MTTHGHELRALNTKSQQLEDGEICSEINGSKYVDFAFELEGTHNLTANKENIRGGFPAPINLSFLQGSFQSHDRDEKIKRELYKCLLESGFDLTKPEGKLGKNLDELTTGAYFAATPSMEGDFEACFISSLNGAMFYIIDDTFDSTREDSKEFILSEKAMFQFTKILIYIYEENPIDSNVMKQLECEVNCPKMMNILCCIIKLATKLQSLLNSKSSICSDEKIRRHYINATRYFMVQYAWHHRYLLEEENLSDEMIFELRASSIGIRNAVELWALSKDINVSDNSRHDPIFRRVYHAAETIIAILNDICSFSKEMSKEEYDNTIMYKCRQGLTFEKASEFVQQRISQDYRDYSNFSKKLREMYSSDSNLQKFLDIFDFLTTSALPTFMQIPRYNLTKFWINRIMLPKAEFK